MSTAPAAEYSADCAALQLDLLKRWVDGGTKKADLGFAQRYLVELLDIPRSYVEKYDQLVARVTRQEANDATRARISPRDLIIVVVATASEVAGSFEQLPGVRSLEIVPFDRN
jgi:hypothetical protein